MAFTEAEKLKICTIVGITADLLEDILGFRAAAITAEVETQVRAELDRWDEASGKFVRLMPTESNYGVKTDSDDLKDDIRKNIAILLYLNDYVQVGGRNYLPRS